MTRGLAARRLDEARATRVASIAIAAATLVAAFGLKRAYGTAGASELEWVLAPSAWLANHLGGLDLVREEGAGFLTHRPRMIVGPACAGVNFLVIGWLALYFTLEARFAGLVRKLALSLACAATAYLVTLATNGLRIALAAKLYALDLGSVLTPSRAHRLLGVVLYATILFALCRVAERACRRASGRRDAASLLVPFGVYVGVAVASSSRSRARASRRPSSGPASASFRSSTSARSISSCSTSGSRTSTASTS